MLFASCISCSQGLVCSADLSGQAYGAPVANEWGSRIIEEFRAQAEREAAEGLPTVQFMATLTSPMAVAKTQRGFLGGVVLPLWQAMSSLLPGLKVHATACCVASAVIPLGYDTLKPWCFACCAAGARVKLACA